MKISPARAAELSATDWTRWAELTTEHRLDSPYFTPSYLQTVAAARPMTEIAIIEDGARIAGYFPYERHPFGIGKPVAGHLSDFQALIAAPALDLDASALLRACRLNAFDFDHQLAGQVMFESFARVRTDSPFVDLSAGADAYLSNRRETGSQNIPQIRRKERRLAEALGPLRFEARTVSRDVFDQTLAWKREQYRRTGVRDVIASDAWVTDVLARVRACDAPDCAGMVSALYAGDRLVAAHIGMRSATVWHYWFPAYDPAHAACSPGSILLLRMIEHAPAIGISRIDLGKGEARYKRQFMNGSLPLIEGRIERASAVTTGRRAARRIYEWARTTAPARTLRRVRHGTS